METGKMETGKNIKTDWNIVIVGNNKITVISEPAEMME